MLTVQNARPKGAVGHCPGALTRLIPGLGEVEPGSPGGGASIKIRREGHLVLAYDPISR